MAVYVTRKAQFSASHRLFNPDFSEEKNWDVYGHCNNLHGHGHNYHVEVTLRGEPNPQTGMLVDLKWLKQVIYEKIVEPMDHKHLNHDVPFLKGVIPTVENLVKVIWDILDENIPSGLLFAVKLYETENNWAIYFGNREDRIEMNHTQHSIASEAFTS